VVFLPGFARATTWVLVEARQRLKSRLVVAINAHYPERVAQQALGHNSKAVHHAYSKHAEVMVLSLDDWEKQWKRQPVARGQWSEVSDLRGQTPASMEQGAWGLEV
jgi:hypothetical protein